MGKRSPTKTGSHWAESVLLLLGHGSAAEGFSDDTFKRHAATLAAREIFRDVRSMTLADANAFPVVLSGLASSDVYLMPMFMSEGQLARRAVEEALRLLAVEGTPAGSVARVCRPLGLSTELASLIVARAEGLARDSGVPAAATSLLLVGHGSTKDGASKAAVVWQADAIAARRLFLGVNVALLEEPPFLADVLRTLKGPVVVAGFFASVGRHAAEEVPRLLGAYANGPIRYTGAIGEDDEISDVIVQAVADADRSSQ